MAKRNNNLNLDIFTALKVAEKSNVPVLLLSNPGQGKTSSTYMFCKVRSLTTGQPMDYVLLRGNSTSAEEVMGYDVSPRDVTWEKPMSAIHLRPSWFQQVLDNHEKGIRTLLFLDEITTANEFVQAALLHLIFERSCGKEKLPEDTLIVAAGNYVGNLTQGGTMALLPPVMNRFMIINLLPDHNDLDIFLNKYDGAIADKDGKCKNYMDEIHKQMIAMDKQELNIPEPKLNKIGEYFERSIKETARMLMTTAKKVDLTVTDLQGIYSDTDNNDSKVYGFVTFRTLNYLRDVTLAFYQCFGKAGICSDIYKSAIDGLCGLGITRNSSKDGDVVKTKIGKEFYDSINLAVNDIEKMNNDKLPEYERFFIDITDGKKEFDIPTMQAIINKLSELKNDKDLQNIERPVDPGVVEKLCELSKKTGESLTRSKLSSSERILDKIPSEKFINLVYTWNTVADLISSVEGLVTDGKLNYKEKERQLIKETNEGLRTVAFKLRSIKKLILQEDKALDGMIPDVKATGTK